MNALHPELNALIDHGLLTERDATDLTALAGAIRDSVSSGGCSASGTRRTPTRSGACLDDD
jgi:hypothetical protein